MSAAPTDEQRGERVAKGSRRKRDLAAVGMTPPARPKERWQRGADASLADRTTKEAKRSAREVRLRPQVIASEKADAALPGVRDRLKRSVPAASWRLWLQPLALIGEVNGALAFELPTGVLRWTEDKYGGLIGDAIRAESDYKGAFLFIGGGAEPEADSEGLL